MNALSSIRIAPANLSAGPLDDAERSGSGSTSDAHDSPASASYSLRALSARAARRALTELKAWVVRNVTSVNDLTGREVLAAGASLDAIVNHVRAQTVETRSTLAALTGDDDSSVASSVAAQAESINEHTAFVHAALDRQTQLADAAMLSLRNITSMAQRVSKLAQSMRMLSLNARIEAARLGSGSVFTVIAQEMTTMTNDVRLANTEIEQIVTDLEKALPQIAQQAHDARDQSNAFVTAMRDHMARVDGSVAVLRNGVSDALRSSDERLGMVLSVSQDGLSHLQFQDTAAQALLRIERDVAEVTEQLAQHLETGELESMEFLTRLEAASSNRARAAGEIATLEEGGMQGGELVFF